MDVSAAIREVEIDRTVPVGSVDAPDELLCDWIEESYRTIAPKRLVAELDAR